jgi:hypothetical protein
MIFAMVVPNDFSPPIASTGIGNLPAAKNSVLIESGELHETRMHCTRHRIQFRIMGAGRFAESVGVGRKLVPEAIEIDAFPAGHQPLHVWAAEAKMPEQGVFKDLVPWPDPGQRCVNENEPRDSSGILRSKRVTDHVADIMRNKIGSVDFQLVKHARHIACLRLFVEASRRLGGEAHSPQVRYDYGVVACKVKGHGCPHVTCLAIAVEQKDGWPRAA